MRTEGMQDSVHPETGDASAIDALASRTWPGARAQATRVAPGLGTRRFYRVVLQGTHSTPRSVIARFDVPPPPPPADMPAIAAEPDMEPIRRFLEEAGLPVPQRFGEDPAHDLCLVEDLGDRTLEDVARSGTAAERLALYRQAAALIPALQALTPSLGTLAAAERRLDARLFDSKSLKLARWALPVVRGRSTTPAEEKMLRAAFAEIASLAAEAPQRLAHRDFKGQNLHVVAGATAEAPARVVMIDFQGAFLAPPEYDAVCLLRDAHVDLPETEIETLREELRLRLPDAPARDAFVTRFDALTLTRLSKDAAHYLRAARSADPRTPADFRYLPLVRPALERAGAAARALAAGDSAFGAIADLLAEIDPARCTPAKLQEGIAS